MTALPLSRDTSASSDPLTLLLGTITNRQQRWRSRACNRLQERA